MADSAGGREVGRISIRVTPNLDRFYRTLKTQLEKIEDTLRAKINVEPDTDGFRQKIMAETKNLPVAKVKVDVDRSALDRVREQIGKVFDGPSPSPSFGTGINGAGYAAIFAGIAALAAPLMGLLTSALLTLPGLISAIAVPVGALALGLDGLKKSAARLAPAFEDLKASMSGAVEQQFGPVFDQLGKLLPTLKGALPKVTQGIADIAKSFSDTITSSAGMAKIEGIISNIGAALSKAAPGIGLFTDGLLTLAEKLTSKLPAVSDWFNGAGKSFSDWITKITADGTLDKAFDGLGATLKTIGEAIGPLFSKGLEFFKDPKNIEDFNAGLKSIGETLQSIVDLSNQLNNMGDLFKNLLPSFDMSAIKNDLLAPFTSADAPWRGMWDSLKSSATEAWNSVMTTVTTSIGRITSVVSSVGATLSNVWNGISSAASAAWNGVIAAVQGAWETIKATVSAGVQQVVAFVASLPGQIAGALAGLAETGASAGRNLIQGVINGVKSMIGAALGAIRDAAGQIASSFASVLGIHSPSTVFAEHGRNTVQGFIEGLQDQQGAAVATAKGMAGAISEGFASGIDLGSYVKDTVNASVDFGRANLDQAMSDLGIGGGALTAALSQGLDFGQDVLGKLVASGMSPGNTFNFQVGSVDDAIAIKNNQLNKDALTYTRR
ncbi:phage tail protein [Mycolicibacterium mageritense]|uniref:Tape measure protein n=1 Tax=Mycolicibacterium mageritense TaxID=53462 RepID=A0AAI8TRC8_MYCME|nr:cation transporter [Mycolicibacterium mageritense]BDY27539.1 hypothetical protein hbim_01463 [Mycolicibacterium mageritense]